MNSDTAAAVRDAINGCPTVISDDDIVERDRSPSRFDTKRNKPVYTGNRTDTRGCWYRPAYVKQSGVAGNDEGATRPVYVVVLEPLWTQHGRTPPSLPSEIVYEAAKFDCTIRFYPPDHRFGYAIWFVDHFSDLDFSGSDGDRCPECDATYFKLRDGEPTCARCGHTLSGAPRAKRQV